MGGGRRAGVRRFLAGVVATLGASALITGTAGAAEHIQNGGFDVSPCPVAPTCDNSPWGWQKSLFGATPIGPICSANTTGCGLSGSGYNTAPNWARLGAGTGPPGTTHFIQSQVSQVVDIPAGPATLRFFLRTPKSNSLSFFTVKLDENTVFTTEGKPHSLYSTYTPVSIDVSAFAGGTRSLVFEGTDTFFLFETQSDSFDIDDVSLKTCSKGKKLKKGRCVKRKRKK